MARSRFAGMLLVLFAAAALGRGAASAPPWEVVDLGTLGGNASVALAVNDAGTVLGTSRVGDGTQRHAFAWRDGSMRDLGPLTRRVQSALFRRPEGLRARGGMTVAAVEGGDAAGWATTGRGGPARAVVYRHGRKLDLGLPQRTESEARALNRRGQVVGDFFDGADGSQHAFLWTDGVAVDLNELIDPRSGWLLQQATGINDAGAIVGVGTHRGATRAFLLLPPGKAAARQAAAAARVTAATTDQASQSAAATPAPSLEIVSENASVYPVGVDTAGRMYGTLRGGNGADLLRSTDEGQTWSRVHSFASGTVIWHIAGLSSGTLLASLDDGSRTIWRSSDAGVTWTQVLSLPSAPDPMRTLTVHSITDGDGYVWIGTYVDRDGAGVNYIYRSSDDGRTWSISNTTTTHRHIHAVRFNDADGKLYVLFGDGDGDGIWESSDDGVTLSPLCTSYECLAVDMTFSPDGSFGIFGQDHRWASRSIVRIDLGDGAITKVASIPYSSFAAARVGDTYLIGTTREASEETVDPNLHLYASNDGESFVDVYQVPIASAGDVQLRVYSSFPNGDFPIQVSTGGTVVARIGGAAPPPPPAFELAVTPSRRSVTAGGSAAYGITVTGSGGFDGSVALTVSGLPDGAAGSFSTNPARSASTLTVTTAASTLAGSYPLTITGKSGTLTRTARATLDVAEPPDFALSATPAGRTVTQGAPASFSVSIAATGGFEGSVQLAVAGLPSGATATIVPNPVTGTTSTTVTIATTSSTPAGSYSLTISGSSDGITRTAPVGLVVQPPPPPPPPPPAQAPPSGGGPAADLRLQGAVAPAQAGAGETLVWSFQVIDADRGPAVDVYLDLGLSPNLAVVSTTSTRGSNCVLRADGSVHCFLDWMSADAAAATVTVTTRVVTAGRYTVTGMVGELIPDPTPANNTLVLEASAPPPPPQPPPPSAPPPPPRVAVTPLIAEPVTIPARPAAGKRFVVSFAVTRSDTRRPLSSATMISTPSVGGTVIPHTESFAKGRARLSFVIPKSARGKRLTVKVTIRAGSRSSTRTATFRVR